jgi:hypothetical protein
MNNLASLMQIAPTTAAGFMGINQAQAEEQEKLKQMELAQLMQQRMGEEQRKQSLHPYDVQKASLGNEEMRAKIPGVMADSDAKGTAARIARETASSEISGKNFENRNKPQRQALGQLGVFSESLNKVPALGRHSALNDMLGKGMGMDDQQRAMMMEHFSKFDGDKLPAELKRISDAVMRNNVEYVRDIDRERLQQGGATDRAKIMANSRDYAADLRGGKGSIDPTKDLEGWLRAEIKGKPPSTQLATYNRAITMAVQMGDTDLAMKLAQQALPLKQQVDADPSRAPRPGTPDMPAISNGRVPVNPSPQAPLVDPSAPLGAPQAQAQPQVGGDIGKLVTQQGEQYRPDLYEYRMGPNGKVQKRPKGK